MRDWTCSTSWNSFIATSRQSHKDRAENAFEGSRSKVLACKKSCFWHTPSASCLYAGKCQKETNDDGVQQGQRKNTGASLLKIFGPCVRNSEHYCADLCAVIKECIDLPQFTTCSVQWYACFSAKELPWLKLLRRYHWRRRSDVLIKMIASLSKALQLCICSCWSRSEEVITETHVQEDGSLWTQLGSVTKSVQSALSNQQQVVLWNIGP